MADGFIGVNPDSSGKKLDTEELVRPTDGLLVERERIVLQRPGDASSSLRPEVSNPPLLGAVRLAVAQLGEIRKTLRQRVSDSADVRRFSVKRAGQQLLRMTGLESLAVAPVEMPNQEAARAGQRFAGWAKGVTPGQTTLPAVTVAPTTSLVNTAPPGGPTCFIDSVGMWCDTGTQAAGASLFLCLSDGPVGYSALATNGFNIQSGSTTGSGKTQFLQAPNGSLTKWLGLAWFLVNSNLSPAGANQGAGSLGQPLGGAVAVPPGYGLGLCILSGAGTSPTFGYSIMWSEAFADME